jgi:hypothetical protein
MQAQCEQLRTEAAAALYRTEAHERPYKAGRGEMYQVRNLLGQSIAVLETLRQQIHQRSS